jgi:ABC-type uncharacterized transport system ATPase subunit
LQLKHHWEVNKLVSVIPDKTFAERISGLGEFSQFAAELESRARVLDVFSEQPRKDLLHIIVQKPLGESYVDLYVVKWPANIVPSCPLSQLTSTAR